MDKKLGELPFYTLLLFRPHGEKPHLVFGYLIPAKESAQRVVYFEYMENMRRRLGVNLLVGGWSGFPGFPGLEIQEKRSGGSQQKEGAQKH